MDQKGALALGALAGAAAALLLRRRTAQTARPAARTAVPPDEDLHTRLDEARTAQADEADFDAAGMGAETIVEDEPSRLGPAPANEFEAMRQRVHEEARAAADEMRRRAETDA
jgi:gas vesicle protein